MNTITARIRVAVAAAPLALLVLLAACGSSSAEPQGNDDSTSHAHAETDANGLPLAHVAARYATGLAADLDTLVASTDVSFVGEVIGTVEQRELAFADTQRSVPITTYLVRVEESNGDPAVGSTVEVEQMGGVITDNSGRQVRVVLEFDSPMYEGDSFLFVANDSGGDHYTASAFARYPVADGKVQAPPAWERLGASIALAGTTVDEAMDLVGARDH